KYYRHSHYPGGLKSATLEEMMTKDSTEIIKLAVKGMLPKNKLLKDRLKRLRVFKDAVHNHEAQKPKKVSFE
ncbi:MAG TPA: uL13 family ribosomal protein, partial [Candidatus Saccharibacteria bacterium]|nr:uL13 family ribosomal protein [Candidatus Saccharibacteria bacterium]